MEYVEFKAATQATVTSPTFLSSTQSVQANSFFFFSPGKLVMSLPLLKTEEHHTAFK